MSRLPPSAAHDVRTNHLPAVAAVITAMLLAACATARSSPAASVAAAGTASPRATSIATSTTAARSPSPTPEPLPTAAHRPQTIHVIEEFVSGATIPIRGCTVSHVATARGGCVGDQLKGRSIAVDAATHENVGELIFKCVMTDPSRNLYDCAIAITLTGRGQIVFDETVVIGGNGPQGPWPIISGTGEFLGATGSVGIPADSTCGCGNFVIAITG